VADDAAAYEVVEWEEVFTDRVHWEDFFTNLARSWQEVRWVARRVFMTRKELVKRFPECGADVPLDWAPADNADATEDQKKAAVYEIWDRESKKAFWISRGYVERPLDVRPDPLKLKDFFPCPKPILGTVGPNSIIPIPDYTYYQDQLAEIDVLTARIDKLIDALRVRGFYSSAEKTPLNNLLSGADNILIPIDSWAALGDKGGVKGLIEWFPLDQIASALKECFAARKQVIEDVYQITGISDIQRGDTDPNETAAAQQLKSIWGSSRVRDRQQELARFSRDLLRIMATKRGMDVTDLILADNNYFQFYWQSLQSIQRITEMSSGQAGYQSLKYMGADVVADGAIGSACPANHMYFLNTDYIKYRPAAKRNMTPLDSVQSINQDASVKLIAWAGNMALSNAQLQGVLIA
jgi:hypothetical protein